MAKSKHSTVKKILEKYGQTFNREIGIHIERNTPSPLFRLLVFALLSSTRNPPNMQ
ncbi:MAG: hypothetical protein R6U50_08515 [Desulfobacterales bacterium]